MAVLFDVGQKVVCISYGKNNTEVVPGLEYTIRESVEFDGSDMVKLEDHPDWWSGERFKLADDK